MNCPKCGNDSNVIDTRIKTRQAAKRLNVYGNVSELKYRRRECKVCKHKFTTYEFHAEDISKIAVNKHTAGLLEHLQAGLGKAEAQMTNLKLEIGKLL